MRAHEVRQYLREVRYAVSRANFDVMRVEIATNEIGKRANRGCIAFTLNEYQSRGRGSGSHANVTPNEPS